VDSFGIAAPEGSAIISEVSRAPLPIDPYLSPLRGLLGSSRAAVLRAAPGAGKTTRVPPALADAGRVVVLQPRRVAARAVARRIADEQGWTVGREVGWHVRFERRFTAETRVLIVTEGMLTAYLDEDPLLGEVSTVVLDEFHERSLHSDLGLALVKQAWLARDDLRVLVMSATLDAAPVSAFLDHCPVIDVPGTAHPLRVDYLPGESVASALRLVLPATEGDVLAFLPGAGEIDRAAREAGAVAASHGLDLVPLHGSLDAEAQDRALRPGPRRRVVLATNIAETSLTVPGVTTVIDTGQQKVARYDAERAIDTLVLERVTLDSADQRAGRAARLGPGTALRLWDARDRLRAEREPEIHRVDLATAVLGLAAAGNDTASFEWFEAPAADRLDAAWSLLTRLGAVSGRAVTPFGHQLRRLPLHPRLATVLLAGDGAFEAAAACALLSEASVRPLDAGTTSCDLLPLIDRWSQALPHLKQVADQLQRLAREVRGAAAPARLDELALRRALWRGFPDRVARRRATDPQRVVLASGRGAAMGRESRVTAGEWLIALDVTGGRPGGATEALVRVASQVEAEWITPTSRSIEHRLDPAHGTVKAVAISSYDAIVISEHPVAADPVERVRVLAAEWLAREPDEETRQWLARLRFAGLDIDLPALVTVAAATARTLDGMNPDAALDWNLRQQLDEWAPVLLAVPSGRSTPLTYRDDGGVTAAVKLQELFGLAETPCIGRQREPVTLELLAPNGRPVQTTRDLRSFWERTYPDVRKELRGRYPKHPWPEDPWTATPTHRTVRRP
jgi:ATP-dependent helicase HrpB